MVPITIHSIYYHYTTIQFASTLGMQLKLKGVKRPMAHAYQSTIEKVRFLSS